MDKIIISGMGIVSAIGNNVPETLQSLRENRSGIAPLRYLQTAHTEFPVGEVKMSNEEMIESLQIPKNQPTARTSLMGMLAVREALENAGIKLNAFQKRVAFINGTTVGGMDKSEQFYLDFIENDTKNAYISTHDCGACTEMIADYFGIFSQVDTISTACSSAANAILLGAELLKSRRADIVVAGGAECITKFHLNGFNTLKILDTKPCRPFDATRAGLNLGEGAAYIVMQRCEYRDVRDERPQSQICLSGYANTCDAFHQTASSPNGEGAYLAMKKVLENAGLQPADIDYINAHGTGTGNNDLSEGAAIERLFGTEKPPVSSTKSFTGHTTSASGGVEAVISILALQNNFLPANLNFKNKIEELNFEPIFKYSNIHIQNVLSNSFGFGGNDTSLIFSKI
ncbi:MAG: beta-ketoacyl-[acyl-carrier-protein] synthase family protein [Prevotellaceae bacterium]|jgi:3-oxoacyl-[acyl-carrier-protein] synthase-1|nr:beta-ketoacyl-[acyl-carrier-protein] synthase family protein [Prevotellaceae bacterium]